MFGRSGTPRALAACLLAAAALALAPAAPAAAQGEAQEEVQVDGIEPPVIDADDQGVLGEILAGPSEPAGGLSFQAPGLAAAAVPETAMALPEAEAASHSPVVVELFTSQGCTPCLAADAMLADLAARPDVLALGFHVDTWDYLGWPDSFARPEFGRRQQAYARRNGERGVYTPQMVFDGIDTALDLTPAAIEALLRGHAGDSGVVSMSARRDEGRIVVELEPAAGPVAPAGIFLVRYLPNRSVAIRAGENRGETVEYANVVVALESVASWDGRSGLRITVVPRAGGRAALPPDTRHAILVQQAAPGRTPGAIVAALRLD